MTPTPKLALPIGTELTLAGTRMTVTGENDVGYHAVDLETGAFVAVSFLAFIDKLKLPGASIDALAATTGNSLRQRLGGSIVGNLPEGQRTVVLFRLAFCHAIKTLRDQIRVETGSNRSICRSGL